MPLSVCGSGFAVCLNCGFAESELATFKKSPEELPKSFEFHAPLQFAPKGTGGASGLGGWINCRDRNGVHELRRQLLTARQVTDLAVIDVSQLSHANVAVATTLAHAFRLAGAQLLSLDTRELGSIVMRTEHGPHCGLVLFDSMPGGAGHVAELLESAGEWFAKVADVLFVHEAHHKRCVTACLDCLLSYDTQFDHDAGLLARAATWEFWDALHQGRAPHRASSRLTHNSAARPDAASDFSDEERLAKVRRKRR